MLRLILLTLAALALFFAASTAAKAAPDIAYGVQETPGASLKMAGPSAVADSNAEFVRLADCSPPSADVARMLDRVQHPGCKLGGPLPGKDIQGLYDRFKKQRQWFDWVFIDHAHKAGEKRLQSLVNVLNGLGYRVATNDNPHGGLKLAHHQWAHAAALHVFRHDHLRKLLKRNPNRLLTGEDRAFIHAVHVRDPRSIAVLKFEIHTGTDRLAHLSTSTQRLLLGTLAKAQRRYGFRLIFPVKVWGRSGGCGSPMGCRGYDSLQEGTYSLMRKAMR